MINFDTLSDENKDLLFSLERRTGTNGEKIGEKVIWFVHPYEIGSLDFGIRVGKYKYGELKMILPENQLPKRTKIDPKMVEFEKRRIILMHGYAESTAILRMPINDQTTVEEVEDYFSKFAMIFKDQVKNKKIEEPEER